MVRLQTGQTDGRGLSGRCQARSRLPGRRRPLSTPGGPRALGTHPKKEPMEALNTAQGARDFIYSLHSSERSCLLKELHRFESIAIAQGKGDPRGAIRGARRPPFPHPPLGLGPWPPLPSPSWPRAWDVRGGELSAS